MSNSSKDGATQNPATQNQVADPAELNAEDLQLLNDGALAQVAGGDGGNWNTPFIRNR